MYKGGSHSDYHAFKSTSGKDSSSGGYGCSAWFWGAIFVLLFLNEICKLF